MLYVDPDGQEEVTAEERFLALFAALVRAKIAAASGISAPQNFDRAKVTMTKKSISISERDANNDHVDSLFKWMYRGYTVLFAKLTMGMGTAVMAPAARYAFSAFMGWITEDFVTYLVNGDSWKIENGNYTSISVRYETDIKLLGFIPCGGMFVEEEMRIYDTGYCELWTITPESNTEISAGRVWKGELGVLAFWT